MTSRIIKLWNENIPVKEMAKKLGCSESFIVNFVCTHRDVCPKRKGAIDYEKLVDYWNAGLSVEEITEKLGCSKNVVYSYTCKNRELCPKRRGQRKGERL